MSCLCILESIQAKLYLSFHSLRLITYEDNGMSIAIVAVAQIVMSLNLPSVPPFNLTIESEGMRAS